MTGPLRKIEDDRVASKRSPVAFGVHKASQEGSRGARKTYTVACEYLTCSRPRPIVVRAIYCLTGKIWRVTSGYVRGSDRRHNLTEKY